MPRKVRLGVLGLQGAILEHADAMNLSLREMDVEGEVIVIKRPEQLDEVEGLIIPGGESTTIGYISQSKALLDRIRAAAGEGMPIFGTCAGLILMAKEVYDPKVEGHVPPLLGLMDIEVARNAFGRQRESFEAEIPVPLLGEKAFPAVFIRAPIVEKVWGEAEVIARYEGKVVGVRERNLLATAFHPELSRDRRFHQHFIREILNRTPT